MEPQGGLVERLTALRQRLEALTPLTGSAQVSRSQAHLEELARQVAQLQARNAALEAELTRPARCDPGDSPETLPARLAYQTRALLSRGKELLAQLDALGQRLAAEDAGHDDLRTDYQRTAMLAEIAIRSVRTFPAATAEQVRLCEGLELCLDIVAWRLSRCLARLERRQEHKQRLEFLAESLAALAQGRHLRLRPFQELAEALFREAHEGQPLHWHAASTDKPETWAAAHCLNTAQVVARLVSGDPSWSRQAVDAVMTALVYDAGMAVMPAEILSRAAPLADDSRRQLEAHVGISVEGARRLAPQEGWLAEAILAHHERLDGTGYPRGSKGSAIPRLARLLAVGDVYAALREARPYRTAMPPATALTETLTEAEKGRLDAELARGLVQISLFPAGTLVELSDGRIAVVVAAAAARADWSEAARPVVRILADAQGRTPDRPVYLNLAQCRDRSIVRALTDIERHKLPAARLGDCCA
jgi:HD-GYP domain-containing protein (c-di-GMP phosphodiesterase class II)